MSFELSMAIVMVPSAILAIVHAFATRPRSEAIFLLLTAAGFGYLFPYVDVNIFGHYGFPGELTIFTLPFHLGFSWWAFYYLAFTIGERVLGRGAEPIGLAVLTGALFGLLEYQWDLTLLSTGLMELFVPSFAPYPYGFHPGAPFLHAFLGYNWVLAFHALKNSRTPSLAILLALLSIVVFPLSIMGCVPLTEPMIEGLSPYLPRYWQHTADMLHFSSTFAGVGLVFTLWMRWLGRRLGGQASRDGRVGL